MEWTDEQVHLAGGPLEGWHEGKVKEALHNYYRGRQNAKTLEYWPLTLKSFSAWFLDDVIVHMLPSMRQHSIPRLYGAGGVYCSFFALVFAVWTNIYNARAFWLVS